MLRPILPLQVERPLAAYSILKGRFVVASMVEFCQKAQNKRCALPRAKARQNNDFWQPLTAQIEAYDMRRTIAIIKSIYYYSLAEFT